MPSPGFVWGPPIGGCTSKRPRTAGACNVPVRFRTAHCSLAGDGGSNSGGEQVRELWARFNSGAFSSATPLFAEDAVYHDTLYPAPFSGRSEINGHLVRMETAFEDGLRYVVDDLSASDGSVGCRWHVELEDGTPLPFARGASMYKLKEFDGELLLVEAWDFPEPTLKVASVVLPVLSVAVKLLRKFPGLLPSSK